MIPAALSGNHVLNPTRGNKVIWTGLFLLYFCLVATVCQAKVEGLCSNCHTMHNSQDGAVMAQGGTGTTLLMDDCVGCHSSATAETIVNGTPIVFNTTVAPANPLAGGNFYWVGRGGAENDVYGHNVWGISEEDANITAAEGAPGGIMAFGCTTSCHKSLVIDNVFGKRGCQGCHTEVAHHDDSKPWFRFLKGHINSGAYVLGIEAPDWEQDGGSDPSLRNVYKGVDGPITWGGGTGITAGHSISAFCLGCHAAFHKDMGVASPWLRHPNNILLPSTGEYGAYDPVDNYSNEAPVAYLNIDAPSRDEAVITCLSCHRAHGSDQPDMLRWDYANMPEGTGCYTCHSTKK